ncbi:MAG: hypothetical protein HUJ27_00405 [Rhodobacteraceae bacterium]|nr:hypothetical protein [Paracoccaceae bacterium]
MTRTTTLYGSVTALAFALSALPAVAQDQAELTTAKDVRIEIAEAMEAVGEYSAKQRDEAIAAAEDALARVDAEIERREEALRENWADMSETARETARVRLQDLRAARNELGESYGALQNATSSGWDELTDGFSRAWDAFYDAWTEADEGMQET